MTTPTLRAEPPHSPEIPPPSDWTDQQWAALGRMIPQELLVHDLWILLADREEVLEDHHLDADRPRWASMLGQRALPRGWDRRVYSIARIAEALTVVNRHPGAATASDRKAARKFPAHWDEDSWERLSGAVDTDHLFDSVLLVTAFPQDVLRELRHRTRSTRNIPAVGPNDWCWSSSARPVPAQRQATTIPDAALGALTTLAAARGSAGFTRTDYDMALSLAGVNVGKRSVQLYLQASIDQGLITLLDRKGAGRGGAARFNITNSA